MIVIFELFVKIIGAKKSNTELTINFEMQRNVRLIDKKKANLQETNPDSSQITIFMLRINLYLI